LAFEVSRSETSAPRSTEVEPSSFSEAEPSLASGASLTGLTVIEIVLVALD